MHARVCVCVRCFCIRLLLLGDKYVVNLSADQTLSQKRDLDHMINRLRLSRQYPVHLQLITRSLQKPHMHTHTHIQSPRTKPYALIRNPKVFTLIYQIQMVFAPFYKATVQFSAFFKRVWNLNTLNKQLSDKTVTRTSNQDIKWMMGPRKMCSKWG